MKNTQTTITLAKYPNYEMAFVLINDKAVFSGNYHDFHSGCHGTKIGGFELKGLWDRGIESLVTALKTSLEKEGTVVTTETKNLTKAKYQALGGCD